MEDLLNYLEQVGGGMLARVAIQRFGRELCQTAIEQGLCEIVHHYDKEREPLDDFGADIRVVK